MKRTIFAIATVFLAACAAPAPDTKDAPRESGQPPQPATATAPAPSAANAPAALSQRCTNTKYGISVAYPAGWHTNDGSVIPACSVFDPAPIEVPPQSEIPFGLAVILGLETGPVDQLTQSSQWERVLSSAPLTVNGRAVTRVEVEATGEGLADRGLRTTRYVIDLGGGRSLVASTHAVDDGYEQNKQVLQKMVEGVTVD